MKKFLSILLTLFLIVCLILVPLFLYLFRYQYLPYNEDGLYVIKIDNLTHKVTLEPVDLETTDN